MSVSFQCLLIVEDSDSCESTMDYFAFTATLVIYLPTKISNDDEYKPHD